MLYPQNDDRIQSTDSVALLHPVHFIFQSCACYRCLARFVESDGKCRKYSSLRMTFAANKHRENVRCIWSRRCKGRRVNVCRKAARCDESSDIEWSGGARQAINGPLNSENEQRQARCYGTRTQAPTVRNEYGGDLPSFLPFPFPPPSPFLLSSFPFPIPDFPFTFPPSLLLLPLPFLFPYP